MTNSIDRKHRNLFIVEDDLFLRKLYRAKFRKLGYENVVFAENAEDAEALLSGEGVPDVVVVDLLLDDNKGVELLRMVKSSEKLRSVPVIALSGVGQEEALKQGILLGANDYLIKTDASLDEVIEKVEKYL